MNERLRYRLVRLTEEIRSSVFREACSSAKGYNERDVDFFLDYLTSVLTDLTIRSGEFGKESVPVHGAEEQGEEEGEALFRTSFYLWKDRRMVSRERRMPFSQGDVIAEPYHACFAPPPDKKSVLRSQISEDVLAGELWGERSEVPSEMLKEQVTQRPLSDECFAAEISFGEKSILQNMPQVAGYCPQVREEASTPAQGRILFSECGDDGDYGKVDEAEVTRDFFPGGKEQQNGGMAREEELPPLPPWAAGLH